MCILLIVHWKDKLPLFLLTDFNHMYDGLWWSSSEASEARRPSEVDIAPTYVVNPYLASKVCETLYLWWLRGPLEVVVQKLLILIWLED